MDDIRAALLGDKEAAKRLTDAGVLVPCPFCRERDTTVVEGSDAKWVVCNVCDAEGPWGTTEYEARLAWNTRAAVEMEGIE